MRRRGRILPPVLLLAAGLAAAEEPRPTPEPYADMHARPYAYNGPGRDTPEPADLKDYPIGVFLPSAGPRAEAGRSIRRGLELAIAEANSRGGIRGLPVRLVVRTDDSPWGSAREVVRLAYEDHVWAVAGAVGGKSSHVVQQIVTKAQLPLLAVATTDASLTEINIPWTFRLMPDDDALAGRLADHLAAVCGGRTIAVAVAESPESQRRFVAFERHWKSAGALRRVHTEADGRTTPAQVRPTDEILILFGDADFARPFVATGSAARTIVVPESSPTTFLQDLRCNAEGLIVLSPCDLSREDPRLEAFKKNFREAHGTSPDEISALAYDGAWLLIRALETAGPNRAKIRDAVAAAGRVDGVTGDWELDGSGASTATPVVLIVRDGGLVSPL